MPRKLGFGSLYPSRDITDAKITNAGNVQREPPATRAASFSACSDALLRKRHSTTAADKSSITLSPPKAANAGLQASRAAHSDMAASTACDGLKLLNAPPGFLSRDVNCRHHRSDYATPDDIDCCRNIAITLIDRVASQTVRFNKIKSCSNGLVREFDSVRVFLITFVLLGEDFVEPLRLFFCNFRVHRRGIVDYEELFAAAVAPQRSIS
jgi:hypothetical protein